MQSLKFGKRHQIPLTQDSNRTGETFSAVDGGLNSSSWSSTGEIISGRIIISR